MGSLTMKVEDAAKLLGISRAGMYRAVERGEIPAIRIGKRILVKTVALEAMLGLNLDDGDHAASEEGEQ